MRLNYHRGRNRTRSKCLSTNGIIRQHLPADAALHTVSRGDRAPDQALGNSKAIGTPFEIRP
jgi:hypothetical protein